MMKQSIYKHPIEVANRLVALGTSRELLLEVVEAVETAKSECTANDPNGARGWRGWQMGTRRNREIHVGMGDWIKDDTDQVPSIVSKKFGIRIVVCNTDDGTTIESRTPQNYSKKGAATDRAVDVNQLSLFDAIGGDGVVVSINKMQSSVGPVLTYYLCVYSDGDDRRAELACPVSVENGFFTNFVERIFIVGGDFRDDGDSKRLPDQDGDSEYKITVKLKKSE